VARNKSVKTTTAKSSSLSKCGARKSGVVPYRDPALSAEKRLRDLLSRMTLEEKAAQMLCIWQKKPQTLVDANGNFDLAKAEQSFKDGYGLGQVGRPSDAGKGLNARKMAETTNAIQKFFVENTRLGIPVVFHEECLHGHAAVGGTSFPQPIALAATFNPDLIESIFTAVASVEGSPRQESHLRKISNSIQTAT
jgi:beta-glucosidase